MKLSRNNIFETHKALSKICSYVLLFVMLVISSGILTSFADYLAEDTVELKENAESENESKEEETKKKSETDDFIHYLMESASLVAQQELELLHGQLQHMAVHLDIQSPPPELV